MVGDFHRLLHLYYLYIFLSGLYTYLLKVVVKALKQFSLDYIFLKKLAEIASGVYHGVIHVTISLNMCKLKNTKMLILHYVISISKESRTFCV